MASAWRHFFALPLPAGVAERMGGIQAAAGMPRVQPPTLQVGASLSLRSLRRHRYHSPAVLPGASGLDAKKPRRVETLPRPLRMAARAAGDAYSFNAAAKNF